jgi:hypothetical protein
MPWEASVGLITSDAGLTVTTVTGESTLRFYTQRPVNVSKISEAWTGSYTFAAKFASSRDVL